MLNGGDDPVVVLRPETVLEGQAGNPVPEVSQHPGHVPDPWEPLVPGKGKIQRQGLGDPGSRWVVIDAPVIFPVPPVIQGAWLGILVGVKDLPDEAAHLAPPPGETPLTTNASLSVTRARSSSMGRSRVISPSRTHD